MRFSTNLIMALTALTTSVFAAPTTNATTTVAPAAKESKATLDAARCLAQASFNARRCCEEECKNEDSDYMASEIISKCSFSSTLLNQICLTTKYTKCYGVCVAIETQDGFAACKEGANSEEEEDAIDDAIEDADEVMTILGEDY